jgi:CheY-like chemotaxis protein
MRVFVCDDNRDYRTLIKLVLDDPFEIVGEATDGVEAIENAPQTRPDLVLLDLNMPRMSGYEALPKLREVLEPQTKILVLTSGRAEDERDKALEAGADGFVRKPESVMALPDEISAALAS